MHLCRLNLRTTAVAVVVEASIIANFYTAQLDIVRFPTLLSGSCSDCVEAESLVLYYCTYIIPTGGEGGRQAGGVNMLLSIYAETIR